MITRTTQSYTLGPESLYLHAEEKAFPDSEMDVPTSTMDLSPFDLDFGKCNSSGGRVLHDRFSHMVSFVYTLVSYV